MATADIQALIELRTQLEKEFQDAVKSASVKNFGPRSSRKYSVGLEKILKKNLLWRAAKPILLGSWGERTLTLQSDFEVLFVGDERSVGFIVQEAARLGFPLRARMPASKKNWFYRADYRDELALFLGRALFLQDEKSLQKQISSRKKKFPELRFKKLILKERKIRHEKYPWSVEPNVKFGPGGLRDLSLVKAWVKIKSKSRVHSDLKLKSCENFLLSVRWYLHLFGASKVRKDQLLKEVSIEITKFFHGLEQKKFYRSLYQQFQKVDAEFFSCFEKSRSKRTASAASGLGRYLKASSEDLGSLFRSQALHKSLPDLDRLTGYVQFDQYHLYPANKHIEQACVLTAQFVEGRFSSPLAQKLHGFLFPKSARFAQVRSENKVILKLLALFHDLSKGLQGDHSEVGSVRTEKILIQLGISREISEEVKFLVAEHLTFSHLAFRGQPAQATSKKVIKEKGFNPRRSALLLAFTVIDIVATNPSALTSWKETLLEQIWKHYIAEPGLLWRGYGDISLDQVLMDELGEDFLVEDLQACERACSEQRAEDLKIQQVKGMIWVRLHDSQDRIGLLADGLTQLFSIGASVDQAFVLTHPRIGVYDWFKIAGFTEVESLKKRWAWKQKKVEFPQYHLQKIEIFSEDQEVLRILVKGEDQKGLLAYLAHVLSGLGLRILELRATTWGQRVEDMVVIQRPAALSSQELISLIQEQF